ncbi:MAG: transglycosylase SLT domain-containing protein [Exilibacterium sp.]
MASASMTAALSKSAPALLRLVLFYLWFAAPPGQAQAQPHAPVDEDLRRLLKNTIAGADSFADRFDAEVWLVAMSGRLERFLENPKQRLRLLRSVHLAATRANLQPEMVLAVIEVESRFDRFAVSSVGAQGMMQVMPFWKHEIGRPNDNLIDLETNLKYGCTILKYYLDKANGRWIEALARYNGSYGSFRYSRKVMDAWERWR